MEKVMMLSMLAATLALGAPGAVLANDGHGCTLKSLHGRYVFTARGFTIVGAAAQPKAIVEIIDFDGDGGVSVPKATVSLNGQILRLSPGASGTYTLDEACTGTIMFADRNGTAFDVVTSAEATKSG